MCTPCLRTASPLQLWRWTVVAAEKTHVRTMLPAAPRISAALLCIQEVFAELREKLPSNDYIEVLYDSPPLQRQSTSRSRLKMLPRCMRRALS